MNAGPRDNFRLVVALIWVLGLAALVEIRWIWPGLLFLGAATGYAVAWHRPERRNAGRVGTAMLVVGIWATMRFSPPALLVALGTAIIVSALFRRPSESKIETDMDAGHDLD